MERQDIIRAPNSNIKTNLKTDNIFQHQYIYLYKDHFDFNIQISWSDHVRNEEDCLESRSRGISYMKYVNGRLTGLVKFCVETAFYSGLLKERYKGG